MPTADEPQERPAMSKALIHARSSARKYGGKPEDYLAIHERMDSSKSAHAEVTHRCVFHSAFGIYIIEDMGWIPSLSDWMREMPAQPWMAGARKVPMKIVE